MAAPTLWHFSVSHYTEKARWALDYKQLPHHRRLCFLDYPIRNLLRTGQLRLPVLFADGLTICDSTEIIAYLEKTHPSPPLYPEAPEPRERALALEEYFDEEVGPHIRAVLVYGLFRRGREVTIDAFTMGVSALQRRAMWALYPIFRRAYSWRHQIDGRHVDLGHKKLAAGLKRLEAELGSDEYLVDQKFSVADLTAASLLYPFAMPDSYPYPISERVKQAASRVFSDLDTRFAAEWVSMIYRRHRGASAELPEP